MKFLFITTLPVAWGGSEWLWAGAAAILVRQGHAVGFCQHAQLHHPALVNLRRIGAEEFIETGPRRWWNRWWESASGQDSFQSRVLARFQPDLIVVSQAGQHPHPEWAPALAAKAHRYSAIVQAVNDAQALPDREADTLTQFLGNSHRNYFVASANRQSLELMLGSRIPRTQIVRNPFRVAYDAPFSWPAPDDEVHLGLAGRLEPEHKGQEALFETLALPAWRDLPIWLHLYGSGAAEQRLRRAAAMLGLSRVVFEGHVDDVAKIWRRCHVVAQPSRQEGMPITVVEGMLMGRPVFGTRVAGIPEFVEEGANGFLAEACTPELLDRALQRLWSNRGRLPEMGRAAQGRARALVPPNPAGVFASELVSSLAA